MYFGEGAPRPLLKTVPLISDMTLTVPEITAFELTGQVVVPDSTDN